MNLESYTTGNFDRGAPKWKEALWIAAKMVFFLPPWPLPSGIRVALLEFFGAEMGTGVVIRSQVNITFPWKLTVGDHAWIGEESLILNLAPVHIGAHSCISQRAFLCTGNHKFDEPGFDLETKPIRIEDRSWIGATAFVAPGCTIGPDSMATAGAVVVKDIAPGTISGGNPAREIRKKGTDSA